MNVAYFDYIFEISKAIKIVPSYYNLENQFWIVHYFVT